jgi:pimeloyl-ACP methyl ester carboxylesterase
VPIRLRRAPDATVRQAAVPAADLDSLDDVTGLWPGRFVDVAGTRMHVRTTPARSENAEPALFVHGLGGSSGNWTDLAGLLRHRLAIEALDLPGFGLSEPPAGDDYSLDAAARAVIAYLEQSGRGPVHLVSNSMGGAIAILVAARLPGLVRTLTLISPAVPDNALRLHPLRHDWRLGLLVLPFIGMGSLRYLGRVTVESRVKATVKLCFADPSRLPQRRFDEMVEELRERVGQPWADRAMLRATRALARAQLLQNRRSWSALRMVEAPTLVVWGDTDRLVAPDLAPFVAAAIPDSRLLVLPHIGHVAMLEDPDTTARAVIGLLDEVGSAPSDVPDSPAEPPRVSS